MNTEQIKSLTRHLLTAAGMFLVLLGVDKQLPIVEYLQTNLDGIFAAVTTLIGVGTTLWGFFKNQERWQKQEDQK